MTLLILALILLLVWKAQRVLKTKQVIENHEGEPYLIRYFIYKPKDIGLLCSLTGINRIYLHHIIRSDYDRALHDHPWSFVSIMLKGGYREVADYRDVEALPGKEAVYFKWNVEDMNTDYRDFKAPAYLRRPATWRHRLELKPGKSAWTLVFTSNKQRRWGFWTTLNKFCYWRNYDYVNLTCAEPEEIRENAG